MRDLVKALREELPKAFRQEAFDKEKTLLREKYNKRAQELNAQFDKAAREKGFLLQIGPRGNVMFTPLINGRPLQSPEEFSQLQEAKRQEIAKRQEELVEEMASLSRSQSAGAAPVGFAKKKNVREAGRQAHVI